MTELATLPKESAIRNCWRVMIVEDNHAVAAVHSKIVNSLPHLQTVHVAFNGELAFEALPNVQPDLVILDLTMPGGNGMTFLRRVRAQGIDVDVIVVSASRTARVVKEAVNLGIVDYLVKPFSAQRLRQSIAAFAMRRRTAEARKELRQADVDAMQLSGSQPRPRRLPKGFSESTMKEVISALAGGRALTAEEVGSEVGVARVTARRYLEYLALAGLVELERESSGPGRPRNRYRGLSSRRSGA